MAFENILLERLGGMVGLIRLNRPQQLNALNRATLTELAQATGELDRDEAIGAMVLTGNERAFAAGADIKEFAAQSLSELMQGYRAAQYDQIRQVKKPLIAAVSGFAFGGGCELALHCDLIIASETARFAQPEINLGLIPGGGGTQRLTRQVGQYTAMEVVLGGRSLSAWEAHKRGLVSRVVPVELYLEEAIALARSLASRAPVATRLAKESVKGAMEVGLEAGLHLERKNFYLAFASEDAKEGLAAFVERRKAQWKGR